MPRPRVTFSRKGTTSSGPSGPPKESSSKASYGCADSGGAASDGACRGDAAGAVAASDDAASDMPPILPSRPGKPVARLRKLCGPAMFLTGVRNDEPLPRHLHAEGH